MFNNDLTPRSEDISLTDGFSRPRDPVIVFNNGTYVIAWFDPDVFPASILAAVLSEDGELLTGPAPVTDPGSFRSRYPYLRALGDRLLLALR